MTKKFVPALLLVLLMAFSFTACKKEKDDVEQPSADLAESAKGTYEMYHIESGGQPQPLPANGISGTVYVNRTGENVVSLRMVLRITQTGESPEENLDDIELKPENNSIAMYSGQDKIGTIDGDELEISGTDSEGQNLVVKARK